MRGRAPTQYGRRRHAPTAHPVGFVYQLRALCRYPQAESAGMNLRYLISCQPSLTGRQGPVGFKLVYQLGVSRQKCKQTDERSARNSVARTESGEISLGQA